MSPTLAIILFVIGVVLFLTGLYLSYQSSQAQKTFEQAKSKLDEERSELEKRANTPAQSSKKSSGSTPKKDAGKKPVETGLNAAQEEELRKQIGASRDKLSKQREKNKHITRERDDLKKRVSDLQSASNQPAHDANLLVDMRMELAEAKQEAALFKQRIDELEKSGKSRKKSHKSEPVEAKPVEPIAEAKPAAPIPEAAASSSSEDQAAYIDELKGRIRNGEREMREQESELRKRLKKQGRDVERQMRRADNNDKAYRITQRELDAARERITMLNEQLDRARFAASSTTQAQDHPGLVDIAQLEVHAEVPEEEMTMESPEVTQDIIEQDAALAGAADIIGELANEASQVIAEETPVEEPVEAELPEPPTQDEPESLPEPIEELPEQTQEAPEQAQEATPEEEPASIADEPVAEVSEPVIEELVVTDEPVEVTPKAPEEHVEAQTEVERIAEPGEGLAEVSDVDEAWGDIDLDDDDDDL